MNKTILSLLLAPIVIALAGTGGGWYRSGEQLRELRRHELAPIAALLHEDQEILQALQTDSSDAGISRERQSGWLAGGAAR